MQFSESWLRSLANPSTDTAALAHALTMAGLEVEEMDAVAPTFDNIVVAQVISREKHPDADRLSLCKVDAGEYGELQIVCGAPNVAAGLKVPCALVGAKLPGIEIKKAKVRGIESFGMLCSAKELGIAEESNGLLVLPEDAPVGVSIREYLDLDDTLITIKLTPNRADCLSMNGIAREVGAITDAIATLVQPTAVVATFNDLPAAAVDAPQACPRYCGRLLRKVNGKAATPTWMLRRLERAGLRSISAIVDVTNYVMLELGQPMHAFDSDTLQGTVRVRYPQAGEKVVLLNDQEVTPASDMLVIADDSRILALAGLMGAQNSGVGDETINVMLESAFFQPDVIVGKARALGFSTDSSFRFERGVDFQGQVAAIERATQLILEICGGEAGPVNEVVSVGHLPVRKAILLRSERVAKVLGIKLETSQIAELLGSINLQIDVQGESLLVTAPSFRFDLTIEEDLIEEVGRLYGYDNIAYRAPMGKMVMSLGLETKRGAMSVRRQLAGLGYQETINFSFVESAWEADFAGNPSPITLANPIASQMGVMRSNLIGGLVAVLATNRKRQLDRVRVFEIGRCFSKTAATGVVSGFDQPVRIAGLAAGSFLPEQWAAENRAVDYFDIKADVETVLSGQNLSFEKLLHPALHPGRAATVLVDEKPVGFIGELHPRWVQKYDLGTSPVVFEVALSAAVALAFPAYQEVSRYPAVMRDLALVVPQGLAWADLVEVLTKDAPAIVRSVQLFDLYQGNGVAEGSKSLAFRIVMQDTERTLAEAEVEACVADLLARARARFGAELR